MAYMVEILSLDDVKDVGFKGSRTIFFSGLGRGISITTCPEAWALPCTLLSRTGLIIGRQEEPFSFEGQRYKWDSSIPIADQFLLPDGKLRGRGPSTHSQRSPEMTLLEMRGYMSLRAP